MAASQKRLIKAFRPRYVAFRFNRRWRRFNEVEVEWARRLRSVTVTPFLVVGSHEWPLGQKLAQAERKRWLGTRGRSPRLADKLRLSSLVCWPTRTPRQSVAGLVMGEWVVEREPYATIVLGMTVRMGKRAQLA